MERRGGEERERERETSRAEEETTKEEERWEETRLQKRREEYLNRDVALQVGVRPSGCRSSGELVEESTLQR